jgi:hypothetical protein
MILRLFKFEIVRVVTIVLWGLAMSAALAPLAAAGSVSGTVTNCTTG